MKFGKCLQIGEPPLKLVVASCWVVDAAYTEFKRLVRSLEVKGLELRVTELAGAKVQDYKDTQVKCLTI